MRQADPSLSLAERVDAVCDRFEAEWRAGKSPSVDAYVSAAAATDRDALREALVGLQRELLARSGADTSVSAESARDAKAGAKPERTTHFAGGLGSAAKIGRFDVLGTLGEGAYGRVYRAFDPHLAREVAIKVPLASAVPSDEDRARFLREAKAAATINHPNVCQILEVGETDGTPYIVMAMVPGSSLAQALAGRKEPFPQKQAALVVRKIALALAAAHEKGIVHRDLKPANVMFDRERKDVIVMDFGLARGPKIGDARDTQSGVVMGTPAYMSPEQARGDSKSVGPKGDVYSLGVILYELLTGTRPYTGTATEVLGQILHVEPEAPSRRRPDVDPRLEAVCLQAMRKDPGARYGSMKELAAALDAFVRAPAGPSGETAKPEQTRKGDAATATSANLADVFAVLSMDRKRARAETAAAVSEAAQKARTPRGVWIAIALAMFAGFVVLGGLVFFTRSGAVRVTLDLRDLDLNDSSLAFYLDEKLVPPDVLAKPIELSPGDHVLVAKRGDAVVRRFLISVTGGRDVGATVRELAPPAPLPKLPPPPPVAAPQPKPTLKPSPLDTLDAKEIPDELLERMYGSRAQAPPELVAVYTNFLKDKDGDDVFWSLSLSSNGKIAATSHYPWTIIEMHDLTTGRKFGDVATAPGSWVIWNKMAPDNQSVYFVRKDAQLHGSGIGGKERWSVPTRGNWSVPDLSPDGATIATGHADDASIRLYDAQTGEPLATWPDLIDRSGCRLRFSPNGQTLAVQNGNAIRFLSVKDGKTLTSPTLENPLGSDLQFSPDGKKIYLSRHWKQIDPYCLEYDLATGKRLDYRHAPNGCQGIRPNPAFPIFVTHDNQKNLHFWDAARGPDQTPFVLPFGDRVERMAWTPEGRYLVIASRNRLHVLRLPVDRTLPNWRGKT